MTFTAFSHLMLQHGCAESLEEFQRVIARHEVRTVGTTPVHVYAAGQFDVYGLNPPDSELLWYDDSRRFGGWASLLLALKEGAQKLYNDPIGGMAVICDAVTPDLTISYSRALMLMPEHSAVGVLRPKTYSWQWAETTSDLTCTTIRQTIFYPTKESLS